MKIKSLITVSLLSATVFATAANAETRWPNWYVGLHGGWGIGHDYDVDPGADANGKQGYILGASLGYVPPTTVPFFDQTRFELEYSYRENDIKNSVNVPEVESHSTMVNIIYDINTDTNWTPYIGAGLGASHVKLGGDSDTVFAWQGMLGLDYAPESMPMTVWGLRYRYLGAQDVDASVLGTPFEMEYDSHSIEAAARFRF